MIKTTFTPTLTNTIKSKGKMAEDYLNFLSTNPKWPMSNADREKINRIAAGIAGNSTLTGNESVL